MDNIGWIIVSVSTATLIGIIVTWLMLRGKRSGFPVQEERAFNHELMTLGGSLVVLGIVFGTDRLIGYSSIGAGVLLSIISVIKSRRKEQRSSVAVR